MNKTRELDASEVVAVLMPGLDDDGERAAIVIVREPDGHISVSRMDEQDASLRRTARGGCGRRGRAGADPVSPQLSGFERKEAKLA